MIESLPLRDTTQVERWSNVIARWIFLTGVEHFELLFGDARNALGTLQCWVRRPTSEFSGLSATLASAEGVPVGVFLAMPGAEARKRRSIDTLCLLKDCKPERRIALRNFLTAFTGVLAPVTESDFYLRTLSVDEAHRGRGLGGQLMGKFIAEGEAAGFRRFRLDVAADNEPALSLYRRFGFTTIREAETRGFGLRTYSMVMEK